MMRSVGQSPGHHPGSGPAYVEKRCLLLPPLLIRLQESFESMSAVLGVSRDELESRLTLRQWPDSDIYAEHRPKPSVLADTLMNHLLVNTSAAWIVVLG